MGQTRVDLQHLLEDLRDAYPGGLEETILTEIVANSLDSRARKIELLSDPAERTLMVVDDGQGMVRRELARFHDIATTTKTRGEGIGFAGVGIKLGLLAAEEVVTETRTESAHVATRWRLASRHRAPWQWIDPPRWLADHGTAVSLRLRNPLSALLDAGYLETVVRRQFEPLLDHAFDEILRDHYPDGVAFVVNGRALPRRQAAEADRVAIAVRLPRKRKPAALGYVERSETPLPEDRQGVAISTLGKVIRRGWDWLGLAPASPAMVAGLIEAPGLAVALTLNKGDFVRTGRRGIVYLAHRKALQEVVSVPLAAWGEHRDREDAARRRAARPLERDLETVLVDLAEEFPSLAALVERRAGGQRRLPVGDRAGSETVLVPVAVSASREPAEAPGDTEARSETPPSAAPSLSVEESEATTAVLEPPPAARGPRRPARYGLSIDYEERPDLVDVGRLVESTVWVNTAHPAYRRAVASRAEGYHAAVAVAMALATVAVDETGAYEFVTAFLRRWGEALGRDRRRRRDRPRHGRGR